MDRGGRALREAIQQYLEAIQSEPGHSWLSAAAHALGESTRKGYAAALRRLRKHSREQFGASPRQVLELEIKEMVETSLSTAKKGGQASGMWRSGHGQSGGYCSFGKSDESNTGVPTCPFPSRTRRDYRQDGKRLLEARTSKDTGGMHCVGVGRRSYGAPASRRSCSQEGGSLPVSPRITATRRTCGPAKDGCTSRFRWTGGGGTGGAFQYRSEERPVDSMWPRWVRADLRDAAPQRCPGAQASAVGTKRRKRSKSLEPTSAARTEYDSESSSEGEYRFMECDR